MDFNETIELNEHVLSSLKKLYVDELNLMTTEEVESDENKDKRNVIKLINTIAAKQFWFKICPQITLRDVDSILQKQHGEFKLEEIANKEIEAGSMSYEHSFDVIFSNRYNRHELYGVSICRAPSDVFDDPWDDYIANEGDELLDVKKVQKEEEVKVVYNLI
jgi:hypothetical protein